MSFTASSKPLGGIRLSNFSTKPKQRPDYYKMAIRIDGKIVAKNSYDYDYLAGLLEKLRTGNFNYTEAKALVSATPVPVVYPRPRSTGVISRDNSQIKKHIDKDYWRFSVRIDNKIITKHSYDYEFLSALLDKFQASDFTYDEAKAFVKGYPATSTRQSQT